MQNTNGFFNVTMISIFPELGMGFKSIYRYLAVKP
jgi:hypothetical protein